jgi:N-acetylneuraminate synthase
MDGGETKPIVLKDMSLMPKILTRSRVVDTAVHVENSMSKHEGTVSVKIATRNIGPDYPPFIVAEIGSNHGGDIKTAKDLVIAAKESGASCVKIQCYTADNICTKTAGTIGAGLWAGQDLYELYKKAETPPSMAKDIINFAKSLPITCFSSVFDLETVDFLVSLGVPALKIASFELVSTPLIGKAAATGLPLIISCGMGTHGEIKSAISAAKRGGCRQLALLHCISNYPAFPQDANLGILGPLRELNGVAAVGFSDHTPGVGTACAAVAFGATIIEKHLVLDRTSDTPDAAFSLDPAAFQRLVTDCRAAWAATCRQSQMGLSDHTQASCGNVAYRPSLWVTAFVPAGHMFSPANVGILRPANGLPPSLYGSVLAGTATRDLPAGTYLCRGDVSTLAQS